MDTEEKNLPQDTSGRKKSQNFFVRLYKTKPMAAVGLSILIFMVLVAVFADVIAPCKMVNGTLETTLSERLEPPSLRHLFGTDSVGRDLFSYMVYGTRTSVVLALSCTVISTVISVIIGLTGAVIGGWFDLILQRFADAWRCIPAMLIMLILMSIMGNGMIRLIVVLSIPGGIGGARMIRSAAMSVKDLQYNQSAYMQGAGKPWVMMKHVLPNIMPVILMGLAGSIGGVVMTEASLNFLGYGVSANTPDRGAMLTGNGRTDMYRAPWLAIIPGIAIALVVFASAMFGDGVRDLLDPRLQGSAGTYRTKGKKVKRRQRKMLNYAADVAIIGAGVGVVSAACHCAKAGLRVLLFEASDGFGPAPEGVNGVFAVGTDYQKSKHVNIDKRELFWYLMNHANRTIDARQVTEFLNRSAGAWAMLESMGCGAEELIAYNLTSPHTWHYLDCTKPGLTVPGDAFLAAGGQLISRVYMDHLLTEDGRCVGAAGETAEGEQLEVRCDAVVPAAGEPKPLPTPDGPPAPLGPGGRPIPGLFGAGGTVSFLNGRVYTHTCAGSRSAFGMVSGEICGETIPAYLRTRHKSD